MYPDYAFYISVFGGSEDEDIIMPFIKEGYNAVCAALTYPAEENNRAVLMAACAQGEYLARSEFSSVKLGDFSASVSIPEGGGLCSAAAGILEKAGLLYRGGVSCR